MTAALYNEIVLTPAFRLLPVEMDTTAARVMLITIALQESGLRHRRQIATYEDGRPIFGPARGWSMFEVGGVTGVLTHHASKDHAREVIDTLGYGSADASTLHVALEHNDLLAACFARLLLWTDPRPLPLADKPADGWLIYLATWRPGKPHAAQWSEHYAKAWRDWVKTRSQGIVYAD